MLPLVMTAAIVADDQTFLRAAPDEKAPHPVILWKGDWLEVRGEARGYLEVYDHRHERAGYVAPERVRRYPMSPESAPRLRAVLEFLVDGEDEESLGIAVAALYLRTAPPEAIDAGVFDAIGTMAERLAARMSARPARPSRGTAEDLAIASRLEVASSYGLVFRTFTEGDRTRIVYDGEAYRRLLALAALPGGGGATPAMRARATLHLTDPRNVDPALGELDKQSLVTWQAGLLDALDPSLLDVRLANRVHMRRAHVSARIAFVRARKGEEDGAREASERAIVELAKVDRGELRSADARTYEATAVLVAAERWAAEGDQVPPSASAVVKVERREGGETCLRLSEGTPRMRERCSHGVVWKSSVTVAPGGERVAVSVEPVLGWVELWVFAKTKDGWTTDTIVPGLVEPELGYVEHAGWLPDGARFLAAREVIESGALRRELVVVDADTLLVEKSAPSIDQLPTFRKHASPAWRAGTLALR